MSVDISKWGPAGWDFMYAVAFAFPENPSKSDKQQITAFFNSVKCVLPCKSCQKHFKKYVEENPIELNNDSKSRVASWLLKLNNDVNARINKPPITMIEVWDRLVYDGPSSRRKCVSIVAIILLVLIITILIIWRLS